MGRVTPVEVMEYIQEAYRKYYDSTFWIRDEAVMQERRSLLTEPDFIAREILLEAVLAYPSIIPIEKACKEAGLPEDIAKHLKEVVFGSDFDLMQHQAESLVTSLAPNNADKRNIIVTSSTGSGKTECFLLPIVARLLAERLQGAGSGSLHHWWEQQELQENSWANIRSRIVDGPKPAIRALLLYPTNALVEDQISRLRQAAFRAKKIHGHPLFYFGRYIGATPGGTHLPTNKPGNRRVMEIAREIRKVIEEAGRLRDRDEDIRSQFQDPTCGEMLTRWDMISAPPDIMITNFSMLNVMLMRDHEKAIFETTKEWLESSPDNHFSLVVDELHSYRGTQGTEVSLVIRNLLLRLGIKPDSPQLRCLGTSASLDGEEGRKYLQEFFGVSESTFAVFSGESRKPSVALPIDETLITDKAEAIIDENHEENHNATQEILSRFSPRDVLGAACLEAGRKEDDSVVPAPISKVKEALFGDNAKDESFKAILHAVAQEEVTSSKEPKPSFRAHMFFRQIQGMWACSNPECSEVDSKYQHKDRKIGKIFRQPAIKCPCGGQVLELLYCTDCGEIYLGGYIVPWEKELDGGVFLESGPKDLLIAIRKPVNERPNNQFRWYWPRELRHVTEDNKIKWQHKNPATGKPVPFALVPAVYEPFYGRIKEAQPHDKCTGTTFQVPSNVGMVSGIPEQCPACRSARYQKRPKRFFTGSFVNSPIRASQTGLNMVTQVIADSATSILGADHPAPMIIFTDSREDAADVAAGLELNHFRSLVRQLVFLELNSREQFTIDDAKAVARKVQDESNLNIREKKITEIIKAFEPNLMSALLMDNIGHANKSQQFLIENFITNALENSAISWSHLISGILKRLLELGENPQGTEVSKQMVQNEPWWRFFDETRPPNIERIDLSVQEDGRQFIRNSLSSVVAAALFDSGGRDLETLGMSFVRPSGQFSTKIGLAPREGECILANVIRLLGQAKFYEGSGSNRLSLDTPIVVRKYLEKVALQLKQNAINLEEKIGEILKNENIINENWILQVTNYASLNLELAPTPEKLSRCDNCSRVSANTYIKACTSPRCESDSFSPIDPPKDDFYHWLSGEKAHRLNVEELTAQTKPLTEQRKRQRLFKEAFLEGESQLVHGIDILSVTTTMEFGVDIGSLELVMMANMPPQRFNYQQRVGRAGRAGQSFSYALTICRGGAHDNFYYSNPERITGDTPPQPYLDLSRPEIVKRVMAAETLRRAFSKLNTQPRRGKSMHGSFGMVNDWETKHKTQIAEWLSISPEIKEILNALCHHTLLSEEKQGEIEYYCRTELADRVSEIADSNQYIQEELSERLATAGVLPMFGFPTQTRQLFNFKKNAKVEEMVISERPLNHAVWTFSPGSEISKDKQIHVICGFEYKRQIGSQIIPDTDPLGPSLSFSKCVENTCGNIVRGDDIKSCDVCGSNTSLFNLYQPKGFLTTSQPKDYDGHKRRGHVLSLPILAFKPDYDSGLNIERMKVTLASNEPIALVNDASGELFKFRRKGNSFVVNDEYLYRDDPPYQELQGEPDAIGAIGAVFKTDIMTLLLEQLPGVGHEGVLDIQNQKAATVALTSFAEFVKLAAAIELDVDPSEFQVGTHKYRTSSCVTQQIYIADSLENGAGYTRHLYNSDRLKVLLERHYDVQKSKWQGEGHALCDTSCPDCLRSYNNRFLHGKLDWRLALDIAELALGYELEIDRWLKLVKDIGNRFIKLCNNQNETASLERAHNLFAVTTQAKQGLSLVLCHPLWSTDPESSKHVWQRNAKTNLHAKYGSKHKVLFVDLRDLAISPQSYIVEVVNHNNQIQ